jgi:hypothetical protein
MGEASGVCGVEERNAYRVLVGKLEGKIITWKT